jgi:hypothetical protein
MTEGWICEDGHPLYRIDDVKICKICPIIAEVGAKENRCRLMGHTVPVTSECCTICNQYSKIPWHKELDQNGVATCPAGHTVTHEDMLYNMRGGKSPERKCYQCVSASWKRANAAYVAGREAVAAAEGREIDRRYKEARRLPLDYFDWVVALRLIEGKVDEVYDMRRDNNIGPTAMEKWVAYHSTTDDYNHTRTQPGGPKFVRHQWAETGQLKKWKPRTLAQAMSEL